MIAKLKNVARAVRLSIARMLRRRPHRAPLPIGWGEGVRRTDEGLLDCKKALPTPH